MRKLAYIVILILACTLIVLLTGGLGGLIAVLIHSLLELVLGSHLANAVIITTIFLLSMVEIIRKRKKSNEMIYRGKR